jgi:hypothetical protein
VITLAVIVTLGAAQSAIDPSVLDQSTCLLQAGVTDNCFTVQVTVKLSDEFKRRAAFSREFGHLKEAKLTAEVQRRLEKILNAYFKIDLPISIWIRPEKDLITYLRTGRRPAKEDPEAFAHAHTWAEAKKIVEDLIDAHPPVPPDNAQWRDLPDIFADITRSRTFGDSLTADTPLRLDPAMMDFNENSDGKRALILVDPVIGEEVSATAIRFGWVEGQNSSLGVLAASLQRVLKPLVGQFWVQREIQARLVDYYALRGVAVMEPLHLQSKIDTIRDTMRGKVPKKAPPLTDDQIRPKDVWASTWSLYFPAPPDSGSALAVTVNGPAQGGRSIIVEEPAPFTQITILPTPPAVKIDSATIRRMLSSLLDEPDWRAYLKNPEGNFKELGPDEAYAVIHLRQYQADDPAYNLRDRAAGPWILTAADLARRAEGIAALKYTSSASGGIFDQAGNLSQNINVTPIPADDAPAPAKAEAGGTSDGTATAATTGPTAATPTPSARISGGAATPPASGQASAPATGSPRPLPVVGKPPPLNKLLLSAGRTEGQGGDFSITYQRLLAPADAAQAAASGAGDPPASVTLQAGGKTEAYGDGSIEKEIFLPFFGRYLAMQARGYSDFRPQRPLQGSTLDERRTGGAALLGLDLFRAQRGAWLRAELDAKREHVSAEPSGGGAGSDWYESSATASFICFYQEPASAEAGTYSLGLSMRAARAAQKSFQVGTVAAHAHRALLGFWEIDSSLRAAQASPDTPVVDLPYVGGDEGVRGYREQAGAGRRMVKGQFEVWWPLRCLERRWPTIGGLRRQLYVAGFMDLGAFSDPVLGTKKLASIGAGVRLMAAAGYALKLDLAHGICRAGAVEPRWSLTFNLSKDFPY